MDPLIHCLKAYYAVYYCFCLLTLGDFYANLMFNMVHSYCSVSIEMFGGISGSAADIETAMGLVCGSQGF